MALVIRKVGTQYRIELEVEEFQAIETAERYPQWKFKDCLFTKLEEIRGVNSADYCATLGPSICFCIEADFDTWDIGGRILALIRKHLKACKKFNAAQRDPVAVPGC